MVPIPVRRTVEPKFGNHHYSRSCKGADPMVAHHSFSPQCEYCRATMMLRRVFPRTWTLPEVRAYECDECGNARSVEDEAELVHAV
jgi:hypothetical protein